MEIFLIAGAAVVLLSIVLMAILWYVVSLIFAEGESGQQRSAPWFLKIFAFVVMLFTLFSNRNQQQQSPEL